MARWVDWVLVALGLWLVVSPVTVGYDRAALAWSDVVAGIAVAGFALVSLRTGRAWAPCAAAGVGTWLLFTPNRVLGS